MTGRRSPQRAQAEHPLKGVAAQAARLKQARADVERALTILAGRDQVLNVVARDAGEESALAVAELLGLSTADFVEGREELLKQARQASRPGSADGYDADPRHDPAVVDLITDGASNAEINAKIAELTAAHAKAVRERARRQAIADGPVTPLQRQTSTVLNPWGPDHDPRVMRAILRGAPISEIARLRQQAEADHAEADKAARTRRAATSQATPGSH